MDSLDKALILREWAVAVTEAIAALAARSGNSQQHAENVERAYQKLREILIDS